MYIYFIIGSNSEHGREESSRTHDNNGTYILVYIMFIVMLQFYRRYGTIRQEHI